MKTEHNGLKGWEYFKKLLEEKSGHPISSKMKTEQEVRDAITEEDARFLVGDDYYCLEHLDETVKDLRNLAVVIGKALGVVE